MRVQRVPASLHMRANPPRILRRTLKNGTEQLNLGVNFMLIILRPLFMRNNNR